MKNILSFLWIFLFCLTGCQSSDTPSAIRQTQPIETIQATGSPIANPLPSQDSIKTACNWPEQMETVRSSAASRIESLDIPVCYDLKFNLSPEESSFESSATITIRNFSEQPWPTLIFRLFPNASDLFGGKIEILEIAYVDGGIIPYEIFLADHTGLKINLDQPLEAGQVVSVSIKYRGEVPEGLSSQNVYGIFTNFTDKNDRMLVLADAYPVLAIWKDGGWQADAVQVEGDAVTSDVALYHVEITAPPDWQVISTGSEIAASENGAQVSHEIATGPVRDFFMVLSPDLSSTETKDGEVTVRHWGFKNSSESQELALSTAQKSLDWYEKDYGDYPFTELDVIQSPMQYALGVEYPGAVLINAAMYSQSSQYHDRLETTIAHEVAHQWWYSVIGNDVVEYPWMDEALTSYSSLTYIRETDPSYFYGTLEYYETRLSALPDDSTLTMGSSVSDFHSAPELYSPLVYLKGAMFFLALEDKIGSTDVTDSLHDYYTKNAFEIAEPEDLLDSFAAKCGCDLDPFYKEWGVIP